MKDTKFVKGRCKRTGSYFSLEVKKLSGSWKVVNMVDLPEDEARLLTTEVKQASFETADSLVSCSKCGTRTVGSCGCTKKSLQCNRRSKGYQFGCIYCDEMEIDYSLPDEADVMGLEGKTVKLSQGQEVKISAFNGKPLKEIYVGVGWDPTAVGSNMDVDSSVVLCSGKKIDSIVYYGNLVHYSGCVIHHGDNLTGESRGGNKDDENITVLLTNVPSGIDKISFIVNIYKSHERKQTLGKVKNLYIRLYDPASMKVLVEYSVMDNMQNDTGIIIGEAYRKSDGWIFKAVGSGHRVKNINELADKCRKL